MKNYVIIALAAILTLGSCSPFNVRSIMIRVPALTNIGLMKSVRTILN